MSSRICKYCDADTNNEHHAPNCPTNPYIKELLECLIEAVDQLYSEKAEEWGSGRYQHMEDVINKVKGEQSCLNI